VTLWANEDLDKLSAEDQQMLTDTLYTALHEELSQYFEISDHAGPDTIRLRAAHRNEGVLSHRAQAHLHEVG
jgi:hypothetical protein